MTLFRQRPPTGGVECKGVCKNPDFQPYSLYLRNHTRYGQSYYGMRIRNLTKAFKWYHFNYLEQPL